MVLKVSISLPNNTIITFEVSDPEVFREVVGLALKELPRDMMQMHLSGIASHPPDGGRNAVESPSPAQMPVQPSAGGSDTSDASSSAAKSEAEQSSVHMGASLSPVGAANSEAEQSFVHMCISLSPVGDMRRVVAAAEGAGRHFGLSRVSEKELGPLFDLAGWPRPADFLQTLRNGARRKFRWLERVPGSTGYYTVTDSGRERVLGRDRS